MTEEIDWNGVIFGMGVLILGTIILVVVLVVAETVLPGAGACARTLIGWSPSSSATSRPPSRPSGTNKLLRPS